MKPTKCPAPEKNEARKEKKKGEERKRKVKVKTALPPLNPKTISTFCFLCMPELLDPKAAKRMTRKQLCCKF